MQRESRWYNDLRARFMHGMQPLLRRAIDPLKADVPFRQAQRHVRAAHAALCAAKGSPIVHARALAVARQHYYAALETLNSEYLRAEFASVLLLLCALLQRLDSDLGRDCAAEFQARLTQFARCELDLLRAQEIVTPQIATLEEIFSAGTALLAGSELRAVPGAAHAIEHFIADIRVRTAMSAVDLNGAIASYREILTPQPQFAQPKRQTRTQLALAFALCAHYRQSAEKEKLREALSHFSTAIAGVPPATDSSAHQYALRECGFAWSALFTHEPLHSHLRKAVAVYEQALVQTSASTPVAIVAEVHHDLARAYFALASAEKNREVLRSALRAIVKALEFRHRYASPQPWFASKALHAEILSEIARTSFGTSEFAAAITEYRLLLAFALDAEDRPAFMRVQSELALLLSAFGCQVQSREILEDAVTSFRIIFGRESRDIVVPQNIHHAFGMTLLELARYETRPRRIFEAVHVFRLALSHIARDREPLQWNSTQADLAQALIALGRRLDKPAPVAEALELLHTSAEYYRQLRRPLEWAATEYKIALAHDALDEILVDIEPCATKPSGVHVGAAIEALNSALTEQSHARSPEAWLQTLGLLGALYAKRGKREDGVADLAKAAQILRQTQNFVSLERERERWKINQEQLAFTLHLLARHEVGTLSSAESVAAYAALLNTVERNREPLVWAGIQHCYGNALYALGRLESTSIHLRLAVLAYENAIEERSSKARPLEWAQTLRRCARARTLIGEREGDCASLELALSELTAALSVFTREHHPQTWRALQHELGHVFELLDRAAEAQACFRNSAV